MTSAERGGFSAGQELVLARVAEGRSVFFTGGAGTGKSFLLKEIVRRHAGAVEAAPAAGAAEGPPPGRSRGRQEAKSAGPARGGGPSDGGPTVYVTASTGLAAMNIGGITIHSFGGIGVGSEPVAAVMRTIFKRTPTLDRWRRTKLLIIDEISMIRPAVWDLLEEVARRTRNSPKPFGGIQVVACGDFLQLPPVIEGKWGVPERKWGRPERQEAGEAGEASGFAYEAKSWNKCFAPGATIVLDQVYRQRDRRFVELLAELRHGHLSLRGELVLRSRLVQPVAVGAGLDRASKHPGAAPSRLEPARPGPTAAVEGDASARQDAAPGRMDPDSTQGGKENDPAAKIAELERFAFRQPPAEHAQHAGVGRSSCADLDRAVRSAPARRVRAEGKEGAAKASGAERPADKGAGAGSAAAPGAETTAAAGVGERLRAPADCLRLYATRRSVDAENTAKLCALPGKARVYLARDQGKKDALRACLVAPRLELKEGAQVVLLKNLDVRRGLVNGSQGRVTRFVRSASGKAAGQEVPIVKFYCGVERMVEPEKWELKSGERAVGSRTQLPLALGWATTIHKSQGMTLDCALINLAECFECGQAYVAISRVRSLDGLFLLSLDRAAIRAHPSVVRFYDALFATTSTPTAGLTAGPTASPSAPGKPAPVAAAVPPPPPPAPLGPKRGLCDQAECAGRVAKRARVGPAAGETAQGNAPESQGDIADFEEQLALLD
jgi:ATP-dependent DNA helicase PIF1